MERWRGVGGEEEEGREGGRGGRRNINKNRGGNGERAC